MTNEQKAVNEGIRYANRTPLESVRYEPDSEKMYRAAIRAGVSPTWFDVFKHAAQDAWRERGELT
jgi:hypothetical protein